MKLNVFYKQLKLNVMKKNHSFCHFRMLHFVFPLHDHQKEKVRPSKSHCASPKTYLRQPQAVSKSGRALICTKT